MVGNAGATGWAGRGTGKLWSSSGSLQTKEEAEGLLDTILICTGSCRQTRCNFWVVVRTAKSGHPNVRIPARPSVSPNPLCSEV